MVAAFDYTGDPIDLEKDLKEDTPNETYQLDKMPEFQPGWSVRAKIEVARLKAKLRLPYDAPCHLSHDFVGHPRIEFLHPSGCWTSPITLRHAPSEPPQRLPGELPPAFRHLPEHVRAQLMPPQPGHRAKQFARPQAPQIPTPQVPGFQVPTQHELLMESLPEHLHGVFQPPKPYGRSYMAGLGLWLSQTRLQEQLDLREHPYGYADNNPLINSDPTGFAVCGPDVTLVLASAVSRTKAKYKNTLGSRSAACRNISNPLLNPQIPYLNPLGIINSWDTDLHSGVNSGGYVGWLNKPPYYNVPSKGPCSTPQPICGGTVSVNGVCYDAGSVNYVIYGVMMKLCGFSKQRAHFMLDLYKGPKTSQYRGRCFVTPAAGNWKTSGQWIDAGYDGWPAIGPGISIPPGNRPQCSPTCPEPRTRPLGVQWQGFGQF